MSIICPSPLVVATEKKYYTWEAYGDCVVPCPTIEYTVHEWDQLTGLLIVLSLISLVLSFLSFISHLID